MARRLRHRYSSPSVRIGFVLFIATLLLSGMAGFALRPARAAETSTVALSAGCAGLNSSIFDVQSASGFAGDADFVAGERVSITAGAPSTGSPQAFIVYVNFTDTYTTAIPGTFAFTLPANGSYSFFWSIETGTDTTWTVNCQAPGQDPTPTPEPTLTPVPSTDNCVSRGNENAEQASQNGKEHSCLDQARATKQGKAGKHSK